MTGGVPKFRAVIFPVTGLNLPTCVHPRLSHFQTDIIQVQDVFKSTLGIRLAVLKSFESDIWSMQSSRSVTTVARNWGDTRFEHRSWYQPTRSTSSFSSIVPDESRNSKNCVHCSPDSTLMNFHLTDVDAGL